MELIDKVTPVLEPVVEDPLFFLVELYLELILDYTSEIGHCKVNFYNIRCKLCWIATEVYIVLK